MNISGIRTGAGFYDYNSIKINEVRSQQIQEARESEQIPVTGTVEQNDSTDAKVEQIPAAQKEDYGVADFNAKYQPDASYDLKGVDSDISKLDVEKALSDLKKDQVLQQYQFFVGDDAFASTEKLKQEIISKLDAKGFPPHLNLQDQGRFFVGYYHQRQDLFMSKENKEME